MTKASMGKSRSTRYPDSLWRQIRTLWESDPALTLIEARDRAVADHGLTLGPDKGVVSRRAEREHWVRAASLTQLRRQAHRAADQRSPEYEQLVGNRSNNAVRSLDEQVELRAAKLTEHRADWPVIREAIQQAISDLENAPAKAAELIQRERDAQAAKPASKRRDVGVRDELQILRAVIALAKARLDALLTSAQAVGVMQAGERKAWALDETSDDDATFTDEDRQKLDALYVEAINSAERGAREVTERMKAIAEMVASGSTGAVH
jgi:hypothetical protein